MELILILILAWLAGLTLGTSYFVWWFLVIRNPVITRVISQNLNNSNDDNGV